MSSKPAISVRNLSKSYTISHNDASHTTAAEALVHKLKHPFERPETETFWALKDVSFDIRQGDVVGIIGRNGAGKSTMLKVLSRIAEPTSGEAVLRGRVGSLLEVGTGFHPELTGRENIFLNGAILGMNRREITRHFDAIVAFSGTEKFLDTPVKRYSSGMYVRLAFAVAAHLEPEILIIDEVLAVGDAEFQEKCLGKMGDVARSGRTVLFVSHNMNAVNRLCNRAILMRSGQLVMDDAVNEVTAAYLQAGGESEALYREDRNPRHPYQILGVAIRQSDGTLITSEYDQRLDFFIEVQVHLEESHPSAYLAFHVRDRMGTAVLHTDIRDSLRVVLPKGSSNWRVRIPGGLLATGSYHVTAAIGGLNKPVFAESVASIRIRDLHSIRGEKRLGYIGMHLDWAPQDIPNSPVSTSGAAFVDKVVN